MEWWKEGRQGDILPLQVEDHQYVNTQLTLRYLTINKCDCGPDLVEPSNSIFGVFELIQFFLVIWGSLSIDADEKLSQALVFKIIFSTLTSFLTFSVLTW